MVTKNSCKITLLLPPSEAFNVFGGPSKRAVDIHSIEPPGLLSCPITSAKQIGDCLRGGGDGWATSGRAWIEKFLARFLPKGGGLAGEVYAVGVSLSVRGKGAGNVLTT